MISGISAAAARSGALKRDFHPPRTMPARCAGSRLGFRQAGGPSVIRTSERRPHSPGRLVAVSALRATGTVAALVLLYYALPLDRAPKGSEVLQLILSIGAFGVLAVSQVRSIPRSRYPGLQAFEVLTLLVPL